MAIVLAATTRSQKVFEQTYTLEPIKSLEDSQVRFSEPFELKGRKNIVITAAASVDNSWVEIEGDLINQATDESEAFSLPVEYYSGVEDGESWSEGNRSPDVYLSARPAGTYILGFEARHGARRARRLQWRLHRADLIPAVAISYRDVDLSLAL